MIEIKHKLEKKLGAPGIIKKITDLSNSELNSFCMELFKEQSKKVKPRDLLNKYSSSRFFIPAKVEPVSFKEEELEWLKNAAGMGFIPIQLSPLAPLGSCSAVAFVDQNNIVTASRTSEVISDATNVLALHAAREFKADSTKRIIKYCTAHRHTRAQYFTNPALSAHFGAFCMISSGSDSGGFTFETEQVSIHLNFYLSKLLGQFKNNFILKVYYKSEDNNFKNKIQSILNELPDPVSFTTEASDNTTDYYNTLRIKIYIIFQDRQIDLADMGFVDWTQKLLNNKKHRLLISGAGLELIHKIKNGSLD